MQTFLPYPDFQQSAAVLDPKRLGKQRVEAEQIRRVLVEGRTGWAKHPAVRMWRGYVPALVMYRNACIVEWLHRGYRNTMAILDVPEGPAFPPWLGDLTFHRSHQSNLIRKLPGHYGPVFPGVPADLPYVWPVGVSC